MSSSDLQEEPPKVNEDNIVQKILGTVESWQDRIDELDMITLSAYDSIPATPLETLLISVGIDREDERVPMQTIRSRVERLRDLKASSIALLEEFQGDPTVRWFAHDPKTRADCINDLLGIAQSDYGISTSAKGVATLCELPDIDDLDWKLVREPGEQDCWEVNLKMRLSNTADRPPFVDVVVWVDDEVDLLGVSDSDDKDFQIQLSVTEDRDAIRERVKADALRAKAQQSFLSRRESAGWNSIREASERYRARRDYLDDECAIARQAIITILDDTFDQLFANAEEAIIR